eukprot:m.358707 g.358707  ORF g.358707 m.358707 type:complete len:262 (+) comp18243_c0_seq1:98-883(+)
MADEKLLMWWTKFFKQCNLPDNIASEYAAVFEANRITAHLLGSIDRETLKELGIEVVGDVLSILKRCKVVATAIEKKKASDALAKQQQERAQQQKQQEMVASKSVAQPPQPVMPVPTQQVQQTAVEAVQEPAQPKRKLSLKDRLKGGKQDNGPTQLQKEVYAERQRRFAKRDSKSGSAIEARLSSSQGKKPKATPVAETGRKTVFERIGGTGSKQMKKKGRGTFTQQDNIKEVITVRVDNPLAAQRRQQPKQGGVFSRLKK